MLIKERSSPNRPKNLQRKGTSGSFGIRRARREKKRERAEESACARACMCERTCVCGGEKERQSVCVHESERVRCRK